LAGFFLLGAVLSSLGAILPAWKHHLEIDYVMVGNYFLSLNIGLLAGARASGALMSRKGVGFVLSLGSGLAAVGIFFLALVSPPASAWLRVLGLFFVGAGAGLANGGIFQALAPMYEHDRAVTINLAGTLAGLGCLVTSLLVAGAFYVYTVASILFFLGSIPAFFLAWYGRSRFPSVLAGRTPSLREALSVLRDPGPILFALVLFFQFGNEWSIAGWLPLFLIQRMGWSPESALFMLAFYWLCLLVGRVAAQALLPRLHHGKLLMGSVLSAMFGCFVLSMTNNRFGALSGIFFAAAGFALIFPLVIEKMGVRFPSYHPALFNGFVALAITGGLLANGSLGYWVDLWGIGVVMLLPLAGTILVFLLLLLITLETKLSGDAPV
jgi:fucose permease